MTTQHCEKSEQCVDDTYCNCSCEECMKTSCFRPGCTCKKSHGARDDMDDEFMFDVERIYGHPSKW